MNPPSALLECSRSAQGGRRPNTPHHPCLFPAYGFFFPPQRDADRRARQVEALAQRVGEIAQVCLRHRVGARACLGGTSTNRVRINLSGFVGYSSRNNLRGKL